MTKKEIICCCRIPSEILKEYESWMGSGEAEEAVQYGQQDVECLSMMLTLYDLGFSSDEVKKYIALMKKGGVSEKERRIMLDLKRKNTLKEIHFREKQLERIDYLRHKING